MARASALHAEGHRFDSDILHQRGERVGRKEKERKRKKEKEEKEKEKERERISSFII